MFDNTIDTLIFNNCKLTVDERFVRYFPCTLKFTNCDIIFDCYNMISTNERKDIYNLTIESYNSNIRSMTVDELK